MIAIWPAVMRPCQTAEVGAWESYLYTGAWFLHAADVHGKPPTTVPEDTPVTTIEKQLYQGEVVYTDAKLICER